MSTTQPVQRVAVALFEGFTVLDVYGPVQAFASCRTVQPDGKRRPFFEIFSMATETGPVKAGEGPARRSRRTGGACRRAAPSGTRQTPAPGRRRRGP